MSIYHFFIAAIGRRSFCKSVPWAGLRQRDGEWGQKLAFILGSACKRVAVVGGRAKRQMKGLQGVFHRVVRRVSAVTLTAPADRADGIPIQARNVTGAVIARLVQLSSRYAWSTILSFLLLAVVSATYVTRHFA